MKTRFFNQPFFSAVADGWMAPWASVDPDPAGEGEGGGAPTPPAPPAPPTPPAPPAGGATDEGEGLGDKGKVTLRKIREEKDAVARELAEAKARIEEMKPYIPPDKYAEMIARYEQTKEEARQREADLESRRREDREKYDGEVRKVVDERDSERKAREAAEAAVAEEKRKRLEFAKRTVLGEAFYANGGKKEQDEEGTSYFDLFVAAKGASVEYDENDGQAYVIGKDGKRINGEDGKPLTVSTWIAKLADTNPVIASLFEPKRGSGGGGLNGVRGVITVATGDVPSQMKRKAEDLLQEAFSLK